MKTISKKPGKQQGISKRAEPREKEEIKTDYPLSEKDEVKQAEERLRKSARKLK